MLLLTAAHHARANQRQSRPKPFWPDATARILAVPADCAPKCQRSYFPGAGQGSAESSVAQYSGIRDHLPPYSPDPILIHIFPIGIIYFSGGSHSETDSWVRY